MITPSLPQAIWILFLSHQSQGFWIDSQKLGPRKLRRFGFGAIPPLGADELQDRAAQLRREIEDYEASRSTSSIEASPAKIAPEKISDSTWQLTYRFILGDKENIDDGQKRKSFGGTVDVKFRSDGYTDLISQKSSGSLSATIAKKAWGWDVERSPEDDKEYLLFSMDFKLPNATNYQRFYFQALHWQSTTAVELKEGTVTIKQEVNQKASRWALFSAAGILAQFTYVGNFLAKPIG